MSSHSRQTFTYAALISLLVFMLSMIIFLSVDRADIEGPQSVETTDSFSAHDQLRDRIRSAQRSMELCSGKMALCDVDTGEQIANACEARDDRPEAMTEEDYIRFVVACSFERANE